ncbi:MAG: cytochrome C [Desulfuromonadales bacterium]|nr:MAG: cytochrome C [Desulfuromonadales bacterium]
MPSSNRAPHRTIPFAIAVLSLAATLGAAGCKPQQNTPAQAPPQPPAPAMAQGAPQAAVNGAMNDQQRQAMGSAIFKKKCASCHGDEGNGKGSRSGPSLQNAGLKYGNTAEAVRESISKGRPGGMPAFGHVFQEIEIETLVAYVLSLKK